MIGQRRIKQTKAQKKAAYEAVTIRDEDRCQRCLRCGPPQRHHRQPRDDYNTTPAGLIVLGMPCHQYVTEHPREAIEQGWAMPRHTTVRPSEWPARRWLPTGYGTVRLAWVLYLDAPDQGVWWVEISDAEASKRMSDAGWEAAA